MRQPESRTVAVLLTCLVAVGPFPKMAGAASALMGFIQMSCAAAVGYGVGHLHNGTPVPMAIAMAAVGCAGLVTYWLLVKPGQRREADAV